jgi:hypothetical protein
MISSCQEVFYYNSLIHFAKHHSKQFGLFVSDEEKQFYKADTWSRSAGVAVAMSTLITQPETSVPFSSQLLVALLVSLNL